MSVSLAEYEARSTHINAAMINERYINETAHPCQVIGFQPIPYAFVSNQFCFIEKRDAGAETPDSRRKNLFQHTTSQKMANPKVNYLFINGILPRTFIILSFPTCAIHRKKFILPRSADKNDAAQNLRPFTMLPQRVKQKRLRIRDILILNRNAGRHFFVKRYDGNFVAVNKERVLQIK